MHTHIVSFEIGPLLVRAILRRELWLSYAVRSRLLATTSNAVNAIFSSVGVALCCLIFPSSPICNRPTSPRPPSSTHPVVPLSFSPFLSFFFDDSVSFSLSSISFSESSFLRTFRVPSFPLRLAALHFAFLIPWTVTEAVVTPSRTVLLFTRLPAVSMRTANLQLLQIAAAARKKRFPLINFVRRAPRSNFYSR